MTITGDYLLVSLVILALGLTFVSFRISLILFRLAASLSWLALGILLLTGGLGTTIGTPWIQVLGFVFLIMTIAPLTLLMMTEIKKERRITGEWKGFPGAGTESWTEWGPKPKQKETRSDRIQREYRAQLRRRRR